MPVEEKKPLSSFKASSKIKNTRVATLLVYRVLCVMHCIQLRKRIKKLIIIREQE